MNSQTYANREIIRQKRDRLSQLKLTKSNLEGKASQLSQLGVYAVSRELKDLNRLREVVEREITALSHVRATLNNNPSLINVEDIYAKLEKFPSFTVAGSEVESLESEIEQLLVVFDLCPSCLGKTTVYDSDSASGDPYARSSDHQKTCGTCGGSGKHIKEA